MDAIYDFGLDLIDALRVLSPFGVVLWIASELGTAEFYSLLISIIYWNWSKRAGLELLLLSAYVASITGALKIALGEPRPYWLGAETDATESSYGLPSGHASGSIAVYGYLGWLVGRHWAYVTAALVVLVVGISRVYMAVHFPQDVLAGWLIGGLCLAGLLSARSRMSRWLDLATRIQLVGAGLAGAAVIGVIGQIALLVAGGSEDPAEWARFAEGARESDGIWGYAGFVLGAISSWRADAAERRLGGPVWCRVVATLIGLAGVLGIGMALDPLLPSSGVGASIGALASSALIAAWAVAGAPILFERLGWEIEAHGPAVLAREPSS